MNGSYMFVISVALVSIMGCTSYSSRLQTTDVAEINAVIKEISSGDGSYGVFEKLLKDGQISDVAKARILIAQGPENVAHAVWQRGQFSSAMPWLTRGVIDALYDQTSDRMKESILTSSTLANQNEKYEKSLHGNKLADEFRNRMFDSIKSEDRKTAFAQTAAFDTSVGHLKAKIYLKTLAINYLVTHRKFDIELSDTQCRNLFLAVFGDAHAIGSSSLGENRDSYVAFAKGNRSFAKYCIRRLTNGEYGKYLQVGDVELFFQVAFNGLASDKSKYAAVLLSECAARIPKDIWLEKMEKIDEVDSEVVAKMFSVLPDKDCRNCLLMKVRECPPGFVARVFGEFDFNPDYDRGMIEVFSSAVMKESDEGAKEKMSRRILGAEFKDCSGLVNYAMLAAYVKSVDDRIAAEKRAEEERIAARRRAEELARKKVEAEARERARLAKIAAEKAAAEARERARRAKIAAERAEAQRQAQLAEEKKITVLGFRLGSQPPTGSDMKMKVTGTGEFGRFDKHFALERRAKLPGEFMGMKFADLLYTPISKQLFNIELFKNIKGNVGGVLANDEESWSARGAFDEVVSAFEYKYGKKFEKSKIEESGFSHDRYGRLASLHINGMFIMIRIMQNKDSAWNSRDSMLTINVRHVELGKLAEQESPEFQKILDANEKRRIDASRNLL